MTLSATFVCTQGKFHAFYRASNMILHGEPVSLNPDHTHFIFVDDGLRNRYGGVADFRARFERKLCTPKAGTVLRNCVGFVFINKHCSDFKFLSKFLLSLFLLYIENVTGFSSKRVH